MGMTIEDCIHKLDFSIGAYQKLIDENVFNGEVVGTGVRGTWTASTPLNKAYSDMIEALQTAINTMRKYQQLEDFARWVATEVIDEELWTYNHLAFTELACRKLVKLGIMQEGDGEYSYEVVEDGKD